MGLLGMRFLKEEAWRSEPPRKKPIINMENKGTSNPSNTCWQPLCHLQGVISRLPRSVPRATKRAAGHQTRGSLVSRVQGPQQGSSSLAAQPGSGTSHTRTDLRAKPCSTRATHTRDSPSLCLDRDSATQKACVATQTLISSVTLHCVWSSELPGFNRPHRACASSASGQVAPRLPLRLVYSRSYMGVFAGKG